MTQPATGTPHAPQPASSRRAPSWADLAGGCVFLALCAAAVYTAALAVARG